jgi:hypothetical protein
LQVVTFVLSGLYVEYSNTWNLWIVGPLSRSEACTSGMRVDALCKPHAGIGYSLDTPKHLIHVVTHRYTSISLDIGNIHSVKFASCGFVLQDYRVIFAI